MDLELELYGDAKEKTSGNAIGKVYIVSLSSQPVDHEDSTEGGQKVNTVIIPIIYSNMGNFMKPI